MAVCLRTGMPGKKKCLCSPPSSINSDLVIFRMFDKGNGKASTEEIKKAFPEGRGMKDSPPSPLLSTHLDPQPLRLFELFILSLLQVIKNYLCKQGNHSW